MPIIVVSVVKPKGALLHQRERSGAARGQARKENNLSEHKHCREFLRPKREGRVDG